MIILVFHAIYKQNLTKNRGSPSKYEIPSIRDTESISHFSSFDSFW